jgi:hypothetical protein
LLCFSFLSGYICCTGGIHCDNSKQLYIVHWLDHSPPSSPPQETPPCPITIVFTKKKKKKVK